MTDRDEPAVLRLLASALAGGPTGERTPEFFRWKHRANPFGRSPGLLAVIGDEVIGVRLFLRWRLRLQGRSVLAVRAVDTATDPDYQGRGIFRTLTTQALSEADTDGVSLVFNTPNDASRPGYLKMGWSTVGELAVAIRPVHPLRFARGIRNGVGQDVVTGRQEAIHSRLPTAADVIASNGVDVDALLAESEAAADPMRLGTDRSPAYLRWRYAEPPGLDYRAVPVFHAGRLVGLGLGRVRHRGPLKELTLGEVLVRRGDRATARRILRLAAHRDVDHVAAHLDAAAGLKRAGLSRGYLPAPGRGLTLVTNPRRTLSVDPRDPGAWRLALGDLEVF